MSIRSENSVTQGPHQVAHTFINLNLSELFFSNSLIPGSSINFNSTGSFAQSSSCFFDFLLAHLTEQPNTLVLVTGTSLPEIKASIAFRVSRLTGVFEGFSTSSILPW